MSVQNLRNKFSQNKGSVPYNPPGLSYGKPGSTVSSTLHNNNLNNNHNNNNNNNNHHHLVSNFQTQHHGAGGRFKTISEEPDTPEDGGGKPVVTKNQSFLQSYLSNEMTRNVGAGSNGNRQTAAAPTNNRFVASRPVAEVASKFAFQPAQETTPKSSSLKSPQQSPAKTTGSKPMMPPPLPDVTPPKFAVKSSLVLNNNLGGSPPVLPTTAEDRWKNKYDETELKRKSLLIQSQKREFSSNLQK